MVSCGSYQTLVCRFEFIYFKLLNLEIISHGNEIIEGQGILNQPRSV